MKSIVSRDWIARTNTYHGQNIEAIVVWMSEEDLDQKTLDQTWDSICTLEH